MAEHSLLKVNVKASGAVALYACAGLCLFMVGYYFYVQLPLIKLPADIIMWSESDMTGNMIKLLTGAPYYTPPADSNSMIYTPGASMLTYALLKLTSASMTVPHMRFVQVFFALSAAAVATYNTAILRRVAWPQLKPAHSLVWCGITFMVSFLACTAPRVNRFVDCLHTDAAALLVSQVIFCSALRYIERPTRLRLWLMAALPGVGYFFKQFLSSWVGVLSVFLFLDQPKNWKRTVEFAVLGAIGVGSMTGLCWLIWRDDFVFWCFTIMGGTRKQITLNGVHSLAVARSLDHLLRVWLELVPGVVGGFLLLRGDALKKLGALWLSWPLLIGSEALSSGAGWNVLYHFGPAVVIGTSWLMAALPAYWPGQITPPTDEPAWYTGIVRGALGVVGFMALFSMLHVMPSHDKREPRSLPRRISADIYRYIHEIEHEFSGVPASKVLLDEGNWVYLPERVLAKDRAVSLGDQPEGNHYENFAGMLERIHAHAYEKILLRNFHKADFLYDWFSWQRSSGVRQALLDNYMEVRTIAAARFDDGSLVDNMQFAGDVTVLVPKASP